MEGGIQDGCRCGSARAILAHEILLYKKNNTVSNVGTDNSIKTILYD